MDKDWQKITSNTYRLKNYEGFKHTDFLVLKFLDTPNLNNNKLLNIFIQTTFPLLLSTMDFNPKVLNAVLNAKLVYMIFI